MSVVAAAQLSFGMWSVSTVKFWYIPHIYVVGVSFGRCLLLSFGIYYIRVWSVSTVWYGMVCDMWYVVGVSFGRCLLSLPLWLFLPPMPM